MYTKFNCCCYGLRPDPECSNDWEKIALRCSKRHLRESDPLHPDNRDRAFFYCKHRHAVCNARAIVDSHCPKNNPHLFTVCKNNKYNRKVAEFARIELDNARLARNIHKITTMASQVDCYQSPRSKNLHHTGWYRIKHEMRILAENVRLAQTICGTKGTPELIRCNQLAWYEKMERLMEHGSHYPLYWKDRLCSNKETLAIVKAIDGGRPMVYFDFEVTNREIGRVVIELDPLSGPLAVENFVTMCSMKQAAHTFNCLGLDKMIPDLYWSVGSGAREIIKTPMPPKRFRMKHDQKGTVSLINNGSDSFGAEFIITARELPPLDNQNLAIGWVVEGLEFLESLKQYLYMGRTVFRNSVHIVKTGVMDPNGEAPPAPKMTTECQGRSCRPEAEAEVPLDEPLADEDFEEVPPGALPEDDEPPIQVGTGTSF